MKNITPKNKKIVVFSTIIAILIVGLLGGSYAFLRKRLVASNISVNVTAQSRTQLSFTTMGNLAINANAENFGEGGTNISTTASAIASLVKPSGDQAFYSYNVYLKINKNTFVKTGESAELVLRVADPITGNLVSIPKLNSTTVKGVTGYDITGEVGLIPIATNYAIASILNSHTWNFTVTFINLDTDQMDNEGAVFSAEIIIQRAPYRQEYTAVSDVCYVGQALNSCIINSSSSSAYSGLYYHTSSDSNSAGDKSYRYSGGDNDVNTVLTSGYFYIPGKYTTSKEDSIIYDISDTSVLEVLLDELVDDGIVTIGVVGNDSAVILEDGSTYLVEDLISYAIAAGLSDEDEINIYAMYYMYSVLYNKGYLQNIRVYIPSNHYYGGTDSSLYALEDASTIIGELYASSLISIDGSNITITNGNTYDSEDPNQVYLALMETMEKGYLISVDYRNVGINNYVCFGTDAPTCDNDHLYRIIGVIPTYVKGDALGTTRNLVKLIKANVANSNVLGTGGDYAQQIPPSGVSLDYNGANSGVDTYYWNHNSTPGITTGGTDVYNRWLDTRLNTYHLNDYYLNTYLNSNWRNMIETVRWKIGGNTNDNIIGQTAKTIYSKEISSPGSGAYSSGATYLDTKVGLMYVSDYAFANSDWTVVANGRHNWMYLGLYEWTITRDTSSALNVYKISGEVRKSNCRTDMYTAIRPTLFLKSSIKYAGGSGTINDPIRIK